MAQGKCLVLDEADGGGSNGNAWASDSDAASGSSRAVNLCIAGLHEVRVERRRDAAGRSARLHDGRSRGVVEVPLIKPLDLAKLA
jgi:hypothetical protein